MRLGSLASGYLGLDMAVEQVLGTSLAWVSDIDKGACKVLAHRVPDVPNLGDFTRAYWARIEPVDVLTAGYPCQPFSQAGRRKGTKDERHLWPFIATAIMAIRPRLVFLENVAGHLSLGFGDVLGDLARIGYDADWLCFPASDLGACHRRKRVFILAYPAGDPWRLGDGGGGAAADTRGEPGDERRLAASGQAAVGRALGEPAGRGRAPDLTLLPTPKASNNENRQSLDRDGPNLGMALSLLPTPSAGAFNDGEDVNTWAARRERVKLTVGNGNGFGMPLGVAVRMLPSAVQSDRWGQFAAAIARHERLAGRPAPEPTEPGRDGKPRLSARFVEWMQCAPDGWVTDVPGITRNEALKALGNGVVVPQAAHALRVLLERAQTYQQPKEHP